MDNCQSCGMPMTKPEDYGGGQTDNNYCKYCSDDQGKLLPKDKVRENMIQFQMQSLNKSREQAETDVDKHMALMPAWKIGGPAVTPSSPFKVTVSDEPAIPSEPSLTKPSSPLTEPSAFPGAKPTGPGLAGQPLKPSVSQPSVPGSGVPSLVAKPTPKPEPPGIGMPKPSGMKPGGPVPDEPLAKPETPPVKPTFEPSVPEPKSEPFKPEELSTEPSVDLTKGKPSAESGEPEEKTSLE